MKLAATILAATVAVAQTPQSTQNARGRAPAQTTPTLANLLRGEYGPYRANNDLLYYHLDIRVDPEKKFISGKNTIRFRMLKESARIQLDLTDKLTIDKIILGEAPLKYERDGSAIFVDFPHTLHAGQIYSIDFYYSGNPPAIGR